MSNKAMKFRHWQKIQEVMAHRFDMETNGFALKDIMAGPITKHKEDIEDICISALKERDIEAKLKAVTSEWSCQEMEFQADQSGALQVRDSHVDAKIGGHAQKESIIGGIITLLAP